MRFWRKSAQEPMAAPVDPADVVDDELREAISETRRIRAKVHQQWPATWEQFYFTQERLIENDIGGALDRSAAYRRERAS